MHPHPSHEAIEIAEAILFPLAIPLAEPIRMSSETITHASTVLLKLTDQSGRVGWGETSAAPQMTGETVESLLDDLDHLLSQTKHVRWLSHKQIAPEQSRRARARPSARACQETALLDLISQHLGLPVWRLLTQGQAQPGALPVLRMVSGLTDEEEARDIRAHRDKGIFHWKIKVGLGEVKEDIRRVTYIMSVATDCLVSADANGAWSLAESLTFCKGVEGSGLAFVEQALAPNADLSDWTALRSQTTLPIGLDESVANRADLERFFKAQAMDGASLKLIKLGGIVEGVEALRFLNQSRLGANLACKVAETSLSAAATASIGFAGGGANWGLSLSNQYLCEDICAHPLAARNGVFHADQLGAVGIGIIPDEDRVRSLVSTSHSIRAYSRS